MVTNDYSTIMQNSLIQWMNCNNVCCFIQFRRPLLVVFWFAVTNNIIPSRNLSIPSCYCHVSDNWIAHCLDMQILFVTCNEMYSVGNTCLLSKISIVINLRRDAWNAWSKYWIEKMLHVTRWYAYLAYYLVVHLCFITKNSSVYNKFRSLSSSSSSTSLSYQQVGMRMCSEWHYITREIDVWRHGNAPAVWVAISLYANPPVV